MPLDPCVLDQLPFQKPSFKNYGYDPDMFATLLVYIIGVCCIIASIKLTKPFILSNVSVSTAINNSLLHIELI